MGQCGSLTGANLRLGQHKQDRQCRRQNVLDFLTRRLNGDGDEVTYLLFEAERIARGKKGSCENVTVFYRRAYGLGSVQADCCYAWKS